MRPHGFAHDFPFCEVFEWFEHSPVGDFMRGSRVIFPIFEILHLIGLALFVGPLLLTNLGLLGWAMRRQPIDEVAAALTPWIWSGFALLMFTGPVMFTAQAAKWHDNILFWVKMLLLMVAIVFQLSVHRRIVSAQPALSDVTAKRIGALSLLLWISIAFSAKMMELV